MTPEQRLAAFWEIWKTNPDNILETSGASKDLQTLNDSLLACQDKSDSEVATVIKEWCRSYPKLTQKLMDKVGERKLRGEHNDSPNTGDTAYKNIYPKITEILLTRAPKIGKKEGQSQSN